MHSLALDTHTTTRLTVALSAGILPWEPQEVVSLGSLLSDLFCKPVRGVQVPLQSHAVMVPCAGVLVESGVVTR